MQETATASIGYRQQYLKVYSSQGAVSPTDYSYCARVRCYTGTGPLLEPPSPSGAGAQPRLVCLRLRVEFTLWVFTQELLSLKRKPKQGYAYEVKSSLKDSTQLKGKRQRGCSLLPRSDIITSDCIRKVLHTSKPETYKVIRKAMKWGVLALAVKRNGKPWWGHYEINWSAVEWVASLLPMNIGIDFDTMTPKRQVKDVNRYLFGAHRLAVEVTKEFYEFWRTTRVQAFSQALHGWPAGNLLEVGLTVPPFIPPENSVLQYTLLELGSGRLVWSVVLGYGNVYFIPVGVRGGAQSCFPCVSYGSGKYLCAGSLQALLRLLGLPDLPALLSLPEPFPYGGHTPRLVVDTGKAGLVPMSPSYLAGASMRWAYSSMTVPSSRLA